MASCWPRRGLSIPRCIAWKSAAICAHLENLARGTQTQALPPDRRGAPISRELADGMGHVRQNREPNSGDRPCQSRLPLTPSPSGAGPTPRRPGNSGIRSTKRSRPRLPTTWPRPPPSGPGAASRPISRRHDRRPVWRRGARQTTMLVDSQGGRNRVPHRRHRAVESARRGDRGRSRGGWQAQRNLATRTEELSQQLASLAATQEAILAQQRPPEISGLCYLGDPSKPAADVELKIYRFSDSGDTMGRTVGVYADFVRTDAAGRYATGPVQLGDYCVIAPLRAPPDVSEEDLYFKEIQSRPVSLVAGTGTVNVDLDLLAAGSIRVETAAPVPETVRVKDGAEIFISLNYNIFSGHDGGNPIRAALDPIYFGPQSSRATEWPVPFGVTRAAPRPLSKTWSLPPRTYVFTPSLNLSSERWQVWVAPGNSSYLGHIDGQFDVTVLPNETTTVTIALPESFPEAIKDAAPQSQRPNSAMQLAFKPGTVGDIVQKMKLGLNVESVPDGSASTAR